MARENSKTTTPNNEPIFPLAQEIPQYRQAKLAGRKYVGPTKNVSPIWKQFDASFLGHEGDLEYQKIKTVKGQTIVPTSEEADQNSYHLSQEVLKLKEQLAQREKELEQSKNEALQLQEQLQLLKTNQTSQPVEEPTPPQTTVIEEPSLELQEKTKQLQASALHNKQLEEEVAKMQEYVQKSHEQKAKMEEMIRQDKNKIELLITELNTTKAASQDHLDQIAKLESLLGSSLASAKKEPTMKSVATIKAAESVAPDLPKLTTQANAINGIVKSKSGKLVEQAIVMIRDQANHNLRALKTNQLGQFVITTPLSDGTYFIDVSHKDMTFDIVEVELKGELVPPIEIIGNAN